MEVTLRRSTTASRYVAGAFGTVLGGLSAFYLGSYVYHSLGFVLTTAVVLLSVAAIVVSAQGRWPGALAGFRQAVVATALLAFAAPILLYVFAHLTLERYVWAIAQPGLCSHLGSAAVTFTSAMIGWSLASGALGVLIATRRADDRLFPRGGALLAGVLIAVSAAIAIVGPNVGALALGCTP